MPFLLRALASLLIGVSDVSGRASAKRADATSHVTVQMAVVVFVVAFVLGGSLIAPSSA